MRRAWDCENGKRGIGELTAYRSSKVGLFSAATPSITSHEKRLESLILWASVVIEFARDEPCVAESWWCHESRKLWELPSRDPCRQHGGLWFQSSKTPTDITPWGANGPATQKMEDSQHGVLLTQILLSTQKKAVLPSQGLWWVTR